jgi:hypothetical protein
VLVCLAKHHVHGCTWKVCFVQASSYGTEAAGQAMLRGTLAEGRVVP